jgi:broad specificity phosphatase PhoE
VGHTAGAPALSASHRPEVTLVRHGETAWSRSGRHTSRTDLPLTWAGRRRAERIGAALGGRAFARVLTSPSLRARETCRLAGLGAGAEVREELREWDYGSYEGRTTPDIRRERPGWLLWRDGAPGGEDAAAVAARVDRVVSELRAAPGDVAIFAHGHVLRVLGARWCDLAAEAGGRLALGTGSISLLGWEREVPVIVRWNTDPQPPAAA